MPVSRRFVLAALCVSSMPALAAAKPKLMQTLPGVAPVAIVARVVETADARRAFEFRATGNGAPAGRIVLPTWYGAARLIGLVRVADRDVATIAVEGQTGTGVYQELLVFVGVDNLRTLRILGIETLSDRSDTVCALSERLGGVAKAGAGGRGVVMSYDGRGEWNIGCGRGASRPRAWRERWTVSLPWIGDGAFPAVAAVAGAGAVARRLAARRERVAAWLNAAPQQVLAAEDLSRLQLLNTFSDVAPD